MNQVPTLSSKDSIQAFSFGTKAETLIQLKSKLQRAFIPRLFHFTVEQWALERRKLLQMIHNMFGETLLAVRSSALIEDGAMSSQAGAFLSVLKVRSSEVYLATTIDTVVASMTGHPRDQVLVQAMAEDISLSGVIITYDMVHGAPYYCIEYEDESGSTDLVTSGNGIHKSLFVYRHAELANICSKRVAAFLGLARELEAICNCSALDIEFGMSSDGKLSLFQVRRISLVQNWHPSTEIRAKRQFHYMENFISNRTRRRDGILGECTALSVMADWNPAEIIGTRPRPLAASLYRELITGEVWGAARSEMGYRKVPDKDLMILVSAHSYIDVRLSFNSFLPAGLPDSIGEKLINAWLDRLQTFPELHDKVEFEIVQTCMNFCFEEDFTDRYSSVLTQQELEVYRVALRDLTRSCLTQGEHNTLNQALTNVGKLQTDLSPPTDKSGDAWLSRAVFLMGQCKQYGTLPFAIVARHAFIAESLLRSAVRKGALSSSRLEKLRRSIRTVTGQMVNTYSKACRGEIPRDAFLLEYGHLRPGTYEITSLRYDERDDLFDSESGKVPQIPETTFVFEDTETMGLETLLKQEGLDVLNAEAFLAYAKRAIAAREHVKLLFTRILSNVLSALVLWGKLQGLSRDDLSFITWPDLTQCLFEPTSDYIDQRFLELAELGRRKINAARAFRFSHIIFDVANLHVATQSRSVPNFIGTGKASGRIVEIETSTSANTYLKNCIVCVESADPGFDWIFTKAPSGLITKFGGANSHMAIRCAELGIPAAIGCGAQFYGRIVSAGQVEFDCAQRTLKHFGGA